MTPIPGSPFPNFSQKLPYSGLVCPHRCGSWNATYRKNGLQREVEPKLKMVMKQTLCWTTKRSGTKIKDGYEANFMFINTVIPNAIYSVLIENYLKMPLILVDLFMLL